VNQERYSYLGPVGTFTWEALGQVESAQGAQWVSVNNVGEALDDVLTSRSDYAMIAIENSIEGGVSATQDALATAPDLRIVAEYLVPVRFVLATQPGVPLASVTTVSAHAVAYAQCRGWLEKNLPQHSHVPARSNVDAANSIVNDGLADAAIAPPGISHHVAVDVVAENIGDNPDAQTRFVLVRKGGAPAERTGSDKTSIIAELPDDGPGRLLEMLEQFATRGVNMSLLESRPIGDAMGRYRFVIDLDGHIEDERVADALMGLRRFSPKVIYLGSYPRAQGHTPEVSARYTDNAFVDARQWLDALKRGSLDEA